MKCPKCQFENPEEMQFCGKCASKLELICPNCNFSNPPDFIFCGKCAQNLQEPKETSPIDYSEPQSYTPKHLADKILATRSYIEGEHRFCHCLFCRCSQLHSYVRESRPRRSPPDHGRVFQDPHG